MGKKEKAFFEKYGDLVLLEPFGTHRVALYKNGYVQVLGVIRGKPSKGEPERLISMESIVEVSKKTGIGRALAGVVTLGANQTLANMRGDAYLTITTDQNVHVLAADLGIGGQSDIKAVKKLEATAKSLIVRLPTDASKSSTLDVQVQKLADMVASGVLTDEEFQKAKDKLLG